jgi:hypothetical protein
MREKEPFERKGKLLATLHIISKHSAVVAWRKAKVPLIFYFIYLFHFKSHWSTTDRAACCSVIHPTLPISRL